MTLPHVGFLVGFCVYVGIRAFYKQRTKSNQVAIKRLDFIEKALLALLIPGALLFPLVYLFTPWLAFADYRLPMGADSGGLLVMVAALYLFWRSHADLGKNWSQTLEVRKGHDWSRMALPRDSPPDVPSSVFGWGPIYLPTAGGVYPLVLLP